MNRSKVKRTDPTKKRKASEVERQDPAKEYAMPVKSTKKRTPDDDRIRVITPSHPLIRHWLAILRNKETPSGESFKYAMAELGRLLFYEASKDCLPTGAGNLQSRRNVATEQIIDPNKPIVIVPILRAGLVLAEHAASGLASRKTYHLGFDRDEITLRTTVYLNELPKSFPKGSCVFLVDAMVVEDDTVAAALELIKKCGVDIKNIKVISAIVALPAYQKLLREFPGLEIYAAAIDNKVNEGFLNPGIGNAEVRSFGM